MTTFLKNRDMFHNIKINLPSGFAFMTGPPFYKRDNKKIKMGVATFERVIVHVCKKAVLVQLVERYGYCKF